MRCNGEGGAVRSAAGERTIRCSSFRIRPAGPQDRCSYAQVYLTRGLSRRTTWRLIQSAAALIHARGGTPPLVRRAQVQPVDQRRQLRPWQRQCLARFEARPPQKDHVLEPFGQETKPGSAPEDDLDEICSAASSVARERLLPQHPLDAHRSPCACRCSRGDGSGDRCGVCFHRRHSDLRQRQYSISLFSICKSRARIDRARQ